jgi:hypothetical protein
MEWLANPWVTFALGLGLGLAIPYALRVVRKGEHPDDWP